MFSGPKLLGKLHQTDVSILDLTRLLAVHKQCAQTILKLWPNALKQLSEAINSSQGMMLLVISVVLKEPISFRNNFTFWLDLF